MIYENADVALSETETTTEVFTVIIKNYDETLYTKQITKEEMNAIMEGLE